MALTSVLLVRWANGYRWVSNAELTYGRREGFLAMGYATSEAEVDRVGQAILDVQQLPQVATVAGLEPAGAGDTPYVDFDVADYVTVPDEDGSGVSMRVLAITVTEDAEGNPVFAPELRHIADDKERQLQRWLKRLANGSLGGTTEAAMPVQSSGNGVPVPSNIGVTATSGVPLDARQGGSSSDWSDGGASNFTPPSRVIMQIGVTSAVSTTAGAATTHAVTFPTTYAAPPHVLVCLAAKTSTDKQVVDVTAVTETGFTATVFNFDGAAAGTAELSWQAIGPLNASLTLLQEMMADSPFTIHPMQEGSGTTMLDVSGHGRDGGYNGGVTFDAGPGDLIAAKFDGVDDYAQTPSLDLTGTAVVTVAFLLYWNAYAADDDIALEFSPDSNANRGWYVDPNEPTGHVGLYLNDGTVGPTSGDQRVMARPSAAAWHMIHAVYDYSQSRPGQIVVYVDGVQQVLTDPGSGRVTDLTGNHANAVLNVMSRGGTSAFSAGRMAFLAVYDYELSADRIAAHVSASGV